MQIFEGTLNQIQRLVISRSLRKNDRGTISRVGWSRSPRVCPGAARLADFLGWWAVAADSSSMSSDRPVGALLTIKRRILRRPALGTVRRTDLNSGCGPPGPR